MNLTRYFIRRVLLMLPVFLIITLFSFLFIRMAPGNPVQAMVNPRLSDEAIEAKKEELGLNEPLPVQYMHFMRRIFTGKLGRSIYFKKDIGALILQRLPNTVILGATALTLAFIVAIPLGTLAAKYRGTFIDHLSMFVALVGLSMPQFWLGIVLIFIFSLTLGWFPVAGYGNLRHLVLPSIALSAYFIGLLTRLTRSNLLEELGKDYIQTARAKGLSEYIVHIKHGLRNAISAVISLLGLQIGWLVGGAVMVELIFNRPGVGRLIVQALRMRDYPVIQILMLMLVTSVMLGNLFADLIYAVAQPKIRYE